MWWRVVGWAWLLCIACGSLHSDGVEVAQLPVELRGDYALFEQRCSKCHSLERPLGADMDDEAWERTVERMRRYPGSGISPEDVPPILRFLRYNDSHPGGGGTRGH